MDVDDPLDVALPPVPPLPVDPVAMEPPYRPLRDLLPVVFAAPVNVNCAVAVPPLPAALLPLPPLPPVAFTVEVVAAPLARANVSVEAALPPSPPAAADPFPPFPPVTF